MLERAPSISETDPREAFKSGVLKMLKREGMAIAPEDREGFEDELAESDRHVRSRIKHREGKEDVYRFLKMPVPDPAMLEIFRREVGMNRFLAENSGLRTEKIIKSNTDPDVGVPFAIMEALRRDRGEIGFDEHGESFGPREAEGFAKALRELHSVDTAKLPPKLRQMMEVFPGKYDEVRGEIVGILEQKVKPEDSKTKTGEPFHQILGRRLGVGDFKGRVEGLLGHFKKAIITSESGKEILVHGNLDPGNTFIHSGGNVEMIDFEFVGLCKNEIAGAMIDFGNLRARAWKNRRFRNALDRAVIESYRNEGKEEIGRAVVSLGILRSHMVLAGFFENYDRETQREEEQIRRRQAVEDDIAKAWEVAGVKLYDLE